jgi:hypothetical protein
MRRGREMDNIRNIISRKQSLENDFCSGFISTKAFDKKTTAEYTFDMLTEHISPF